MDLENFRSGIQIYNWLEIFIFVTAYKYRSKKLTILKELHKFHQGRKWRGGAIPPPPPPLFGRIECWKQLDMHGSWHLVWILNLKFKFLTHSLFTLNVSSLANIKGINVKEVMGDLTFIHGFYWSLFLKLFIIPLSCL